MSVVDLIEGIGPRVLTGIPTLDRACRGGVPLAKIVIAGGAPGAGKTGLLTQVAHDMARAGQRVRILATDEGADAIAVRLGQLVGGDRNALERREPETLKRVRRSLDALPLDVVAERTIEDAYVDGLNVLVIDSIQTVTCQANLNAKARNSRVESSVKAIKGLRDRGVLILVTSELAREGYENPKRKPRLSDFKGSGDIEYQADLAFAMVTRDGGLTSTLYTVKSRLGDKPEVLLHWNKRAARFKETPPTPLEAKQDPRPWYERAGDWLLGS